MSQQLIEQKQGFSLAPKNIEEAMRFADMVCRSVLVPKDFKDKPGDTLVAMMLGSELGLNPIQAIQNIAVINGRPAIWGDAMLALVQNHPAFAGIVEAFDDSTNTAICTIKRKGQSEHVSKFSKTDAEIAGLWNKAGPWKQYPKRMLQLRARGFALRNMFADALSGLVSVEEARDMEAIDVTSQATVERVPNEQSFYPDEQFNENFPKWEAVIKSGKKSAEALVSMIETKGKLTDAQKNTLMGVTA